MGACGTGTFVAGSYTASVLFLNDNPQTSFPIGATDDGFEIELTHSAEDITSDEFGDSVLDSIYRGGNCFVNMSLIEFNTTGVQRLLQAWAPDGVAGLIGDIGVIGCSAKNGASVFQMTLTLVAPLVTSGQNQPTRFVFEQCALDVDFPVQYSLNSRLRVLPVRVRAYPHQRATGPDRWEWYHTIA